jgi:antitoxin (DNA-binding transcriptional repressor) of toxin-antitoxin stability system
VTSVNIDEFRSRIDSSLEEAARGEVVITQGGRPWLVVHAVAEPLDEESAQRARSAEFWAMIRARRAEPVIGWDEAKPQLDLD